MASLLTCKTCGATQIPETWFGQCKRCYDLPDTDMLVVPTYFPYTKLPPLEPTTEELRETLTDWLKNYGLSDEVTADLVSKTYPEEDN